MAVFLPDAISLMAMNLRTQRLIFVADLAGVFLFAIEGAQLAMQARLDFLGVLVVAFLPALGGGIIRDLLIGATPPSAIRDWRYPALAFAAGTLAFVFHQTVREIPDDVVVALDAAGLSLFAIAGAEKALSFGIHPFIAVLMGGITGVGGGVVRDVVLARVPSVLRTDVYATAALAGAAVMVIAQRLGLAPRWAATLGALSCFGLRMAAVQFHWNLPQAAG
jgi:uncharacterized membrane protein YeiH